MRVALLAVLAIASLSVGCFAAVKIANLDRTIDLQTQIVKGIAVISYENDGEAVNAVSFALAAPEAEQLAHIVAAENGVKDSKLKVTKDGSPKQGFSAYKILLPKPLQKGQNIVIKVDYRVTQVLTALPAKISQMENQFIVYDGSAYAPSMYPVVKQKTVFKLPSGTKIQSFTNVAPSSKDSSGVTYGPYENQEAFAEKFVRVHYENNSPFIVAAQVERLIEISHWGNIAVEEKIEIVHKGAHLDGSFSRLDYQMDRRGSKMPALQKYKTVLPAAAKDIYYRDVIGNISTSDVQLRKSSVDVELRPRFPLFGGWKTTYILGYNLPSHEHMYKQGDYFTLKMKLYDHILDNLVVEKLTTKIVLPETVSNIKLTTPYSVERRPDETLATYLDTVGRTVVVLQKQNLVDSHIQPFTLSYEFQPVNLLREPLMASGFFFVLFLVVIIYVRFDFTIVSDPAKEARERAQGKIDKLAGLVEKRNRTYDFVAEAARLYKSSRDENALNSAKTKADNTRAELNDSISNVLTSIKADNTDVYEKAVDLTKVDKSLLEAEGTFLVAVKKSTQKDGPEDKAHAGKLAEGRARAESILSSL